MLEAARVHRFIEAFRRAVGTHAGTDRFVPTSFRD
jgi:hypothetical protein